jgi:hypothetical protein
MRDIGAGGVESNDPQSILQAVAEGSAPIASSSQNEHVGEKRYHEVALRRSSFTADSLDASLDKFFEKMNTNPVNQIKMKHDRSEKITSKINLQWTLLIDKTKEKIRCNGGAIKGHFSSNVK